MIVVTGANGGLGRAVVENLIGRVPASEVVASVREPETAAALADRGVQVRAGDFAAPNQLDVAFAGAGQVLVVSVDQFGEPARRLHAAAIEAAVRAGAKRVLYTSHMGARAAPPFADHHAAEEMLAGAGAAWTSLRHGFYAGSAFYLIGRGFEEGELRAPEDGPVSWTARDDLAAADAAVLAGAATYDGRSPPLTAPEAFTLDQLAAIASELTGREVRRVVVPDVEWRDAKVAEGVPAPMADALLGMWRAARRGDFAGVDPTLETLIGRRPQTMRDVLARTLRRPDA